MITDAELALARADALVEMRDRLTVLRQGGTTIDPVTLIETPTMTTVASDVPCIVVKAQDQRREEQGGEPLSQARFYVHVPASYTDFEDGDTLQVTSSGDPLTTTLFVETVTSGTVTITRRLSCLLSGTGLNTGDYPSAAL